MTTVFREMFLTMGVATKGGGGGKVGTRTQDYSNNKVCSAGKSCAPRDVTQGNPLRPSVWGFKMRYFPNIYGDFSALNYFSQDNKASISL